MEYASAYAPQLDLDEKVKSTLGRDIPHTEKKFFGEDLNGHTETTSMGYNDVHSDLGFGNRKEFRFWILQELFDLVIADSRKEKHLVTFHNTVAKTQIDLLLRKSDKRFI
ncbi:uncharacterized protein LOC107879021 [Capsicum annuum]|uniref:uncharacterized protein LOC107879021 n=1 Tax=Capsicum annuum TaxID=4072 RepID=UPI0007BEE71C|nr:uncharacterized protein LOC107879021 [Capsicum annuum]